MKMFLLHYFVFKKEKESYLDWYIPSQHLHTHVQWVYWQIDMNLVEFHQVILLDKHVLVQLNGDHVQVYVYV